MDRDIFARHTVLGALLKWLGILLCCAVEWGLFYESVYLSMNGSDGLVSSPSCSGGSAVDGIRHGVQDVMQAVIEGRFKSSCGNG